MAGVRSPRTVHLAGLLAVGVGIALLGVVPAQYGSPPVDLRLSVQAAVLYASTIAGPLLIAWGSSTATTGTVRSLTARRLLLALGLSLGVLALVQWRLWVFYGGQDWGDLASPPPFLLPAHPWYAPPGPGTSPLGFAQSIFQNPTVFGPVSIWFSVVGTTLAHRGKRIAGVLAIPWALVLVFPGYAILERVNPLLVVPFWIAFGLLPFVAGHRLASPRIPDPPTDADSDDPDLPAARERPAIGVADGTSAARRDRPAGAGFGERTRRATLVAFSTGVVFLGVYPARRFAVTWGRLDRVPGSVVVAIAVLGLVLLGWAVATTLGGTIRLQSEAVR